jgi:acetyltransferase EpsM
MSELVILGSRIFAEEVADLVAQGGEHHVAAFAENEDRARCAGPLLGKPVIWVDELAPLAATHEAVCAIGTTARRRFVEQAKGLGFRFANVTHPRATVAPSSAVGAGTIASAGVVVGSHTRIGRHVIMNRGVLVGHHTRVGDVVTLSPGANVAGRVDVGDGCYIGMGAIVLDYRTVGEGSVVAAGAVVTDDVPPHVQVQGVPARIVRRGVDGR